MLLLQVTKAGLQSPVPQALYPTLAVLLLISGLASTAAFYVCVALTRSPFNLVDDHALDPSTFLMCPMHDTEDICVMQVWVHCIQLKAATDSGAVSGFHCLSPAGDLPNPLFNNLIV